MKKRTVCKKQYLFITSIGFLLLCSMIFLFQRLKYSEESVKHRLQWWLSAIEWDGDRTKQTGNGIRIAVLDSGIEKEHPDLEGRIEQEYRVSSLKENEGILQRNGQHGTAAAGIIGAYPSNHKGALGVAVNTNIISIDITDEEDGSIQIPNLIEGIEYAINQSVDIINISAGIKKDSKELHAVIKRAYKAGIVIVAAAGNFMEGDMLYPAKYDEVLAVGALSRENNIISPTGKLSKKVIYLPGEHIVTTSIEGGYIGISGTSAAAPMLTGIIALMLEKNKTLTNERIMKYFNLHPFHTIMVKNCIKLKYE